MVLNQNLGFDPNKERVVRGKQLANACHFLLIVPSSLIARQPKASRSPTSPAAHRRAANAWHCRIAACTVVRAQREGVSCPFLAQHSTRPFGTSTQCFPTQCVLSASRTKYVCRFLEIQYTLSSRPHLAPGLFKPVLRLLR